MKWLDALRETLRGPPGAACYVTPEGEEWRPICYPNFRESASPKAWKYVSSWGRLLADDSRLLQAQPGKGYCQTTLPVRVAGASGGMAATAVHRVVAHTFLGPPPSPFHTVDHRDRCRENNRADNLEWADGEQQLRNREAASYTLSVENGPTFTTVLAFARHAGVRPSAASSLLRQARAGDRLEINETAFVVAAVNRKPMAAPAASTSGTLLGRRPSSKEKRRTTALALYVAGATVAGIVESMGIQRPTVLNYLGKAAREADSTLLARLAARLGVADADTRHTLCGQLDALKVQTANGATFASSAYRTVVLSVLPHLEDDWDVVMETFRSICTALGCV